MAREFDVIVIGAGPAGEIAAGRLAENGKQVALIERELIGGECSFYACMPSKALLRPGELLREARRIPGVAAAMTNDLDVQAVLARRDEVIHDLDDSGQLPWLRERDIELIRGQARLTGERSVQVDGEALTARDAVILAVGSGADLPPIPGLKEAGAWSNREITTAKIPPRSLIVLGGGVVGVEMAQAWSSLGTETTLIEALPRLLAREEPVASELVHAALGEQGVDVRLGVKATEVKRDGDGIELALDTEETIGAERLLVAVGRRPHTDDLGLDSVGLTPGKTIEVDDYLRSAAQSWLYAVGDVNGRALLTHAGKYQARVAADHILGRPAKASTDGTRTPRVVFTDPQVAAVGLTLAQAREGGLPAEAIDLDTQGTAGASFYGRDAPGKSRFVIDTEREILVGVTFAGFEVADFLHAATIAVVAEVPLTTLAHAIPAFPTRSELWLKLTDAYERRRGTSLLAAATLTRSAAADR